MAAVSPQKKPLRFETGGPEIARYTNSDSLPSQSINGSKQTSQRLPEDYSPVKKFMHKC